MNGTGTDSQHEILLGSGTESSTLEGVSEMLQAQISRWIMAANVAAKPSETVRVEERVRSGLCLVEGCAGESFTRGLCSKHYRQFMRTMQAQGDSKDQAEFESKAINKGVVLPTYAASKINRPNPFEDV